jgi:hypothetical protein
MTAAPLPQRAVRAKHDVSIRTPAVSATARSAGQGFANRDGVFRAVEAHSLSESNHHCYKHVESQAWSHLSLCSALATMQLLASSLLSACLFGMAVAKTASASLIVHESIAAPRGYVKVSTAAANTALNLRLGLVSADFATLEKRLYEVSTPSSSKYGQHLSAEGVGTIASSFSSSLTTITGQIIHGAQG